MTYHFSLVRFVPDTARGEFVNIGAVAGDHATGDWDIRFVRNLSRAAAIDDKGALALALTFAAQLQADVAAEQIAGEASEVNAISLDRLRQLSEEMQNVVQVTPPVPVVAESTGEALDLLFDEFVSEAGAMTTADEAGALVSLTGSRSTRSRPARGPARRAASSGRRESPTAARAAAAKKRTTATKRRSTAVKKRSPAAERSTAANKRSTAAKKRTTATKRRSSAAKKRTTATKRRSSAAKKRTTATKRRSTAGKKRSTAAKKRTTATKRSSTAKRSSSAGQSKTAAKRTTSGQRSTRRSRGSR